MLPAVVVAVAIAAPAQASDGGTTKVEEMVKRLKKESKALHGELITEKSAHASTVLDNVRL